MTQRKKKDPRKTAISNTKRTSKKNFPSFDRLVVDGSLPRVKLIIYPAKRKGPLKSNEQLVIELQCEV